MPLSKRLEELSYKGEQPGPAEIEAAKELESDIAELREWAVQVIRYLVKIDPSLFEELQDKLGSPDAQIERLS